MYLEIWCQLEIYMQVGFKWGYVQVYHCLAIAKWHAQELATKPIHDPVSVFRSAHYQHVETEIAMELYINSGIILIQVFLPLFHPWCHLTICKQWEAGQGWECGYLGYMYVKASLAVSP